MISIQKKEGVEKRINPRKFYSGYIFFATKNALYEGQLNNYSRYGLFIETKVPLSVGEVITVALPYLNSGNTKSKGQIMWCNQKGFGVELFRKRSAMNLRLIKWSSQVEKIRVAKWISLKNKIQNGIQKIKAQIIPLKAMAQSEKLYFNTNQKSRSVTTPAAATSTMDNAVNICCTSFEFDWWLKLQIRCQGYVI